MKAKSFTRAQKLALLGCATIISSVAMALINGRQATTLTTYAATGFFRSTTTAQAKLTTLGGGAAIAGQPLELELLYPTYSIRLGTYYTNNSGVAPATLNLSPYDFPSRGSYTLGWTYRGNGTYSAPIPTATITVR